MISLIKAGVEDVGEFWCELGRIFLGDRRLQLGRGDFEGEFAFFDWNSAQGDVIGLRQAQIRAAADLRKGHIHGQAPRVDQLLPQGCFGEDMADVLTHFELALAGLTARARRALFIPFHGGHVANFAQNCKRSGLVPGQVWLYRPMMTTDLTDRQIQRAFRATGGCLLAIGLLIPAMLAQMPIMRERLDLSEDRIGWFLLALGLGAVPSMLASGLIVGRVGSRAVALTVFPLMLLFPPLFGATHDFTLLLVLGFILGLVSGFFDVAANTHGSLLERMTDRYFMTRIHAQFALGVLIGSGLSALSQYMLMPMTLFLGLMSLLTSPLIFFLARDFLSAERELAEDGQRDEGIRTPFPRFSLFLLIALSALMLLGIVSEGSLYDWLPLYATTVFGEPEAPLPAHFGSIALMVFSAGLLIARMGGDYVSNAYGRPKLLLFSTLIGIVGLIWLILTPSYVQGVIAGFLMGIGFSQIFPIFVAVAGRLRGIPAGFAVSIVAAMGWASIFIGPPLIGFIAEHYGYRWAYLVLLPPALIVAIIGPWVVYKSRPGNH